MKFFPYVVAAATCLPATFLQAEVTLDGRTATPEIIAAIAQGESVKIAPEAMKTAENAFKVLCKAAGEGQIIYGLTVGVGLNKDRKYVDAKGDLTQEIIDASSKFQIGLIRAHSGSVGPDMDIRTARATMAARLNMMLVGGAAVQIPVLEAYVSFLNKGLTPCMPSGGSMGEADITICSHVGQAMIGEGEVYYKGKKIPAAEGLKAIGMKPVKLFGKDALAILSSNAYSTGLGALALNDMAQLQRVNTATFVLSIQALNGNVSPFLQDTLALHPFPETVKAGTEIRRMLDGSSIWDRDDNRRLQDPLSFRDSVFTIGEVNRAYETARFLFNIQLNSSDDNPGVAVGVTPKSDRWQEKRSYVTTEGGGGAVLPSANFEPLPWVIAFEQLGIALAQFHHLRPAHHQAGQPRFHRRARALPRHGQFLPRLRRHGEASRRTGHGKQGPGHPGFHRVPARGRPGRRRGHQRPLRRPAPPEADRQQLLPAGHRSDPRRPGRRSSPCQDSWLQAFPGRAEAL